MKFLINLHGRISTLVFIVLAIIQIPLIVLIIGIWHEIKGKNILFDKELNIIIEWCVEWMLQTRVFADWITLNIY